MASILSLEEFISELCSYWNLDEAGIDPKRPLEELGIDSLAKLELVVMLEDFAGHEMPEELCTQVMTLVDVYASYEVYASRDRLGATSLSSSL